MYSYKPTTDTTPALYDTPFLSNVAFPASTLGDIPIKKEEQIVDAVTLASPDPVDGMFETKNFPKKVHTVSQAKKKTAAVTNK
jgi:hypothetical protein